MVVAVVEAAHVLEEAFPAAAKGHMLGAEIGIAHCAAQGLHGLDQAALKHSRRRQAHLFGQGLPEHDQVEVLDGVVHEHI